MEIVYEDNDMIVCHKPAGIATETGRLGQQDMVSLLRNYRAQKGESTYIGMVHRLDQPVEGLLVFGKTQAASAGLSRQVQERSIGKHYCAVAQRLAGSGATAAWDSSDISTSSDTDKAVTLTDYILFDKKNNLSRIVPQGTPQAKRALLDYRVIGEHAGRICFDITLHTGRHHQIRLQLAHHGFPLVGDSKYGLAAHTFDAGGASARPTQAHVCGQSAPLALCAYRLQLAHPTTGEELDFAVRPHNEIFSLFLEPGQTGTD